MNAMKAFSDKNAILVVTFHVFALERLLAVTRNVYSVLLSNIISRVPNNLKSDTCSQQHEKSPELYDQIIATATEYRDLHQK